MMVLSNEITDALGFNEKSFAKNKFKNFHKSVACTTNDWLLVISISCVGKNDGSNHFGVHSDNVKLLSNIF